MPPVALAAIVTASPAQFVALVADGVTERSLYPVKSENVVAPVTVSRFVAALVRAYFVHEPM